MEKITEKIILPNLVLYLTHSSWLFKLLMFRAVSFTAAHYGINLAIQSIIQKYHDTFMSNNFVHDIPFAAESQKS